METLTGLSLIIVAIVFSFAIGAGVFEWARTKHEERKVAQEAYRAQKNQADFWEKHGKNSLVTISRRVNANDSLKGSNDG